jgi:hypothetical protein
VRAVSVNALTLDLRALEEKLEGLQQAISVHAGGVVRLEGLEVSLLATFVVAPSVSAEVNFIVLHIMAENTCLVTENSRIYLSFD